MRPASPRYPGGSSVFARGYEMALSKQQAERPGSAPAAQPERSAIVGQHGVATHARLNTERVLA